MFNEADYTITALKSTQRLIRVFVRFVKLEFKHQIQKGHTCTKSLVYCCYCALLALVLTLKSLNGQKVKLF